MKYFSALLFLFLITAGPLYAQHPITLDIRDIDSKNPIQAVVTDIEGNAIAETDSLGRCVLDQKMLKKKQQLLIKSMGYKDFPLTVAGLMSMTVFMEERAMSMKEAIITAHKKPERLLHAYSESVIDYDITDEGILLATWGGTHGYTGKLIYLNHNGDTISLKHLPFEPLALVRSCDDHLFVQSFDSLYKVGLYAGEIVVSKRYKADQLPAMQACQQYLADKYYYKVMHAWSFYVLYGYIRQNDSTSTMVPFYSFQDKGNRDANLHQLKKAEVMGSSANSDMAAMGMLSWSLFDEAAVKFLNQPLYTKNDSLVLVDLFNKSIRYFTQEGTAAKTVALNVSKLDLEKVNVIKDPATGKFYLQHNRQKFQTLDEIDMETGRIIPGQIIVDKPFVDLLKVYDGNIYYVWQNNNPVSRRQLYVEH